MNPKSVEEQQKEAYIHELKGFLDESFNVTKNENLNTYLKEFANQLEVATLSNKSHYRYLVNSQTEIELNIVNDNIAEKKPKYKDLSNAKFLLGQIKAFQEYESLIKETLSFLGLLTKDFRYDILIAARSQKDINEIPMTIHRCILQKHVAKIESYIGEVHDNLVSHKKKAAEIHLTLAIEFTEESLTEKEKEEKELYQIFNLGKIKEFEEKLKFLDEIRMIFIRNMHEIRSTIYSKSCDLLSV